MPQPRRPGVPIFFFNDPATTESYTLSLHDALPIFSATAHQGKKSAIAVIAYFQPVNCLKSVSIVIVSCPLTTPVGKCAVFLIATDVSLLFFNTV